MRRIAFFGLVLACCSPSEAVAPIPDRVPHAADTNAPAPQNSTLRELETIAAELDRAIAGCADTCCIEQQGWWRPVLSPGDANALRGVITHDKRPRVVALAIRWLAVARNPDDVGVIEPFIDSNEPAWSEPRGAISQMAQPCYPIAGWRELSVGAVALAALAQIVGKDMPSAAAYRAWRGAHARATESIAYWHSRAFPFASADECRAAMGELGARDVALLVRLAVAISHRYQNPAPSCPAIAQIAPIVRARYGSERLLSNLKNPSTWSVDRDPDYAKDTDWRKFAIWALGNADALFDSAQADAIVQLTSEDRIMKDSELLGIAAVAAARFRPSERDRIMDHALAHLTAPPPVFAQAFATQRPKHSAVKKWFFGNDDSIAAAAARGLVASDKTGIALARRFASDRAARVLERPQVLLALAEGSIARGAPADEFSCRTQLEYVCHKISAEKCSSEKRNEQSARRTCLAAFDRWAARR